MCALLLMLFLAASLLGCSNPGESTIGSVDTLPVLVGFPSPMELAAATRTDVPSKSSSQSVDLLHNDFSETLPHPGTVYDSESDETRMLEMWEGGQPAFCIYQIDSFLDGYNLTDVQPDISWDGSTPELPNGLYLGFCDWANNTWAWYSVSGNSDDWIHLNPPLPVNDGGDDFMALVNWNTDDCILDGFTLNTDNAGTVEPWIYYAHHQGTHPDQIGISRAKAPDGTAGEVILQSTSDTWYKAPNTGIIVGSQRLGFARKSTETEWEIWRSELDGSGETRLSWSPNGDRIPVGWAPDGSAYLFIDYDNEPELFVRDTVRKVKGLLAQSGTDLDDACWDYSGHKDYNALLTYQGSGPSGSTSIIGFIWEYGPPPTAAIPDDVLAGSLAGFSYQNPCSYRIPDGHGGWNNGLVCTFAVDNIPYEIHLYPGNSDNLGAYDVIADTYPYCYHWPTVSPDGRWVAYLARVGGTVDPDTLVIASLQAPGGVNYEIATDVIGRPAWLSGEVE